MTRQNIMHRKMNYEKDQTRKSDPELSYFSPKKKGEMKGTLSEPDATPAEERIGIHIRYHYVPLLLR
uniref:Uncharacterized protein n=1 Tax=Rhizophora mucronata TaxID=61149 RepID=A0A2P2KA57_RHIMU